MEPNSGGTDAVIVKKTRDVFDVKFVVTGCGRQQQQARIIIQKPGLCW
jgi:hypothetical protein